MQPPKEEPFDEQCSTIGASKQEGEAIGQGAGGSEGRGSRAGAGCPDGADSSLGSTTSAWPDASNASSPTRPPCNSSSSPEASPAPSETSPSPPWSTPPPVTRTSSSSTTSSPPPTRSSRDLLQPPRLLRCRDRTPHHRHPRPPLPRNGRYLPGPRPCLSGELASLPLLRHGRGRQLHRRPMPSPRPGHPTLRTLQPPS